MGQCPQRLRTPLLCATHRTLQLATLLAAATARRRFDKFGLFFPPHQNRRAHVSTRPPMPATVRPTHPITPFRSRTHTHSLPLSPSLTYSINSITHALTLPPSLSLAHLFTHALTPSKPTPTCSARTRSPTKSAAAPLPSAAMSDDSAARPTLLLLCCGAVLTGSALTHYLALLH